MQIKRALRIAAEDADIPIDRAVIPNIDPRLHRRSPG
jgi:hypothetical protein